MLDALLTAKLKDALKNRKLLHKLKKKSQKHKNESSSSSASSNESESDRSEESTTHKKFDNAGRDQKTRGREVPKYDAHHTRPHSPVNPREERRKVHDACSYEQRNGRRQSLSPRSSRRSRSRSRERKREKHHNHRHEQQHDNRFKYNERNISPEPGSSRMTGKGKKHVTVNRSPSSSGDERKAGEKGQLNRNDESGKEIHYDSDDDTRSKTKRYFGLMVS